MFWAHAEKLHIHVINEVGGVRVDVFPVKGTFSISLPSGVFRLFPQDHFKWGSTVSEFSHMTVIDIT